MHHRRLALRATIAAAAAAAAVGGKRRGRLATHSTPDALELRFELRDGPPVLGALAAHAADHRVRQRQSEDEAAAAAADERGQREGVGAAASAERPTR